MNGIFSKQDEYIGKITKVGTPFYLPEFSNYLFKIKLQNKCLKKQRRPDDCNESHEIRISCQAVSLTSMTLLKHSIHCCGKPYNSMC